jgi:hypothetical protein
MHRKWGASEDGGGSDQQERWSSTGSSLSGTPKAGQQGLMWTPEVAAAMGYGKK